MLTGAIGNRSDSQLSIPSQWLRISTRRLLKRLVRLQFILLRMLFYVNMHTVLFM